MKTRLLVLIVLLVGVLSLSACAAWIAGVTPVTRETSGGSATGEPVEVYEVPPTEEIITVPDENIDGQIPTVDSGDQVMSFSAAEYREESAGLIIYYPVDWSVYPREQIGERGAQAALLSPGSTLEQVAEGGSRIMITTYTWDPKNDLKAYADQRRVAWEASGFEILSEESLTLSDDRMVELFRVKNSEGGEVLFAFTNAGEDYLQVFGEGDLDLCAEIIRSMAAVE